MTLRWRLFPKYATLIIALVGGMLVASGGISLYFSYRENQDHLVALQREKAQAAAVGPLQYRRRALVQYLRRSCLISKEPLHAA